jgi:hypothetical protein
LSEHEGSRGAMPIRGVLPNLLAFLKGSFGRTPWIGMENEKSSGSLHAHSVVRYADFLEAWSR